MASPLMSEMKIETIEDNGPSRSSCLKRTVAQSKVALLTARSQKEKMVDRKTRVRVALLSTRPTSKQLRVYSVQNLQGADPELGFGEVI